MRSFFIVLLSLLSLVSRGATPGFPTFPLTQFKTNNLAVAIKEGGMVTNLLSCVDTLTGTSPTANWSGCDKDWTLSGNSTLTIGAYPYAAATDGSFLLQIIQPAGMGWSVDVPGVYWRTEDITALPADSTNRVIIQHFNGILSATWIEAPEPSDPIWENINGSVRIRLGQLPTELFIQSEAADNATNAIIRADTSSPWTTGNLFTVSNDGALAGSIAAISGYDGSGTHFLSDNGTYQAIVPGGALWSNFLNVLSPNPAIDLVSIQSQLADASTNEVLLLSTSVPWTGGNLISAYNDVNMAFNVSAVSGYTGTGTQFLSDNGTYQSPPGAIQVFNGLYGGNLPTDTPTTTAALAYDLDAPNTLYMWDGVNWW